MTFLSGSRSPVSYFPACCAVLALLSWLPPTLAATPAEELLRLVPDDVGFCVVLQDLRGHTTALLQSEFVKRFRASPFALELAKDKEFQKLARVEEHLQKHLQVNWTQLRDEVFGDAVVFAYRPGPPGKPEEDQDLSLIRARDEKLLTALIERLNAAQKASGELQKVEAREHSGATYYRRVERNKTSYYFVHGPVLAFSSQEAMVRRAIDLDKQTPAAAEPSILRQLRLLGADQHLATLWINPRAFQAELEAKATGAKGGETSGRAAFLAYWKALDGIALSLALRQDFELSLAVRARIEEIPPAARRFLAEAGRRSELWSRFPEDALLAAAGRIDVPALVELVGDFLPPEARHSARDALHATFGTFLGGKDLMNEVLPCIGPDLGVCIAAPLAAEKGWFPHMVLALGVRSGAGNVDQSLLSTTQFFAQMAALNYNNLHPDRLSFRVETQAKVEVKSFANERGFPPGLQPAFALQEGYLVLASSPETIRRFGTATLGTPSVPAAGELPLLRVSLKECRRFLNERREAVIAFVAEKNRISKDEVGERLDKLLASLQFVDRLELLQRSTGPGQATLTLRLKPAWPVK